MYIYCYVCIYYEMFEFWSTFPLPPFLFSVQKQKRTPSHYKQISKKLSHKTKP